MSREVDRSISTTCIWSEKAEPAVALETGETNKGNGLGELMNIEMEIQKFVADNLLFSDGTFDYDNEASFLREGIIDSLGVMELVSFVESRFGIRVGAKEITPENFDSVNKLAQYIRCKVATGETVVQFKPSGHVSL